MKTKVGIIGATGYAGVELIRLILGHPEVELAALGSVSFEGKSVSDVYPSLNSLCDMKCVSTEEVIEKSDVVFACVQHGLSQEFAFDCCSKGKYFIDLGADFRLEKEEDYAEWYNGSYVHNELHAEAVYAIPELFRENIKGAKIIANPGCYPTSAALALFPALKLGLAESDGLIIDSKSGVTGAGRSLSENTHFPVCNEAFSPYKIASHRHTPEIEQTLSKAVNKKVTLLFVPHLLPLNRGIITTAYAHLTDKGSAADIHDIYKDFYKDEKFVRVLDKGRTANLRDVKYSNFCDISIHTDPRTNTLIVVSTLDNMVKGAAGQAVQNMNIILGLDEDEGLRLVPPAF